MNPHYYVFRADVLCVSCAEDILKKQNEQSSEDSEVSPQPVFFGESDHPEHCSRCGEFLKNSLTTDGMEYVRELLESDPESKTVQMWAQYYGVRSAWHS